MIDTKELRRLVEEDGKRNIDLGEIHELLDRIEAAEADALEQARLNGMGSEREAALMAKLEAAEKTKRDWLRANAPGGWIDDLRVEHDALRAKIGRMEKRLRLILEEPENTMSNSKAMREMIRQARLALEESKCPSTSTNCAESSSQTTS